MGNTINSFYQNSVSAALHRAANGTSSGEVGDSVHSMMKNLVERYSRASDHPTRQRQIERLENITQKLQSISDNASNDPSTKNTVALLLILGVSVMLGATARIVTEQLVEQLSLSKGMTTPHPMQGMIYNLTQFSTTLIPLITGVIVKDMIKDEAEELIIGVFNEAARTTANLATAIENIDDQLTSNDRHDLQRMVLDADRSR